MLFNLTNPIPEALKDPLKLQETFKKYSIIPYYGEEEATSHSMLKLLVDLARLSPSHSACKSDLETFAFGGQVNLSRKKIPGFLDTEQEAPVSYNEKVEFWNWLHSIGINLLDVIEISRRLFSDLRDTGNAYLNIKMVIVGGTVRIFLDPINPTECAYLATTGSEDPVLVITEYWDEEWWKKVPPKLVKVSYPGADYKWSASKNVMETVLHLKTDRASNLYYGRPRILPLINWMFAEFEVSNNVAKVASTELVAKHIFLFEETDPTRWKGDDTKAEADFKNRMQSLRKIATNEGGHGEAKSIAGLEYPFGQKAPEKVDLNINRDTQHSQFILDTTATLVFGAHGWSKELTGYVQVKAGIGSNILIDLFTTKNTSTIYPIQSYYENIWADVFGSIALVANYKKEVLTVQFPDLISVLVKSLVETRSTKSIATAEPNADVQDNPPAE